MVLAIESEAPATNRIARPLKAAEFLKQNKPELAATEFGAIVALVPNNVDGRGNLGMILFFQGVYA